MSLIEQIKNDSIAARRAALGKPADSAEAVRSSLLVTLSGEAQRIGKDAGNRAPTDDEVSGVIRKFLKGVDETLKLNITAEARAKAEIEKSILEAYLPRELDETALRAEVALIAAERGAPLTVRDTGTVRTALNAKFPGQINGKLLSDILKGEPA